MAMKREETESRNEVESLSESFDSGYNIYISDDSQNWMKKECMDETESDRSRERYGTGHE